MYSVYGIIGHPVGHSLSPIMHNLAFKELKIKAVYGAFDVLPENLETAIKGIKALGIKGLSVTIPHKEEVMKYLDFIDEKALEISAVNTIVNEKGVLKGFNTDWIGVQKAFEVSEVSLEDKRVVIIGAGGASKAVVYAVVKGGAGEVIIYNRTFEKAKKLAEKFKVKAEPWDKLKTAEGDIIIQTTSVGMKSWDSPVEEDTIKRFKVAMDIVYSPLETKFLSMAKAFGLKVIDGLKMLLYQGVEQFRLWTGMEPPVELMKEAIYRAVKEDVGENS